jgi:hypothetical protein
MKRDTSQKRDGCKYCKRDGAKFPVTFYDNSDLGARAALMGATLILYDGINMPSVYTGIRFCPMCGRKIKR